MAERARAVVLASTGTGDIIPNATVTVREPGTATAISETIYSADDPDASQYTNGAFFTSATGIVTFYLTNSKRVDVLFTKAGYTSVTIPVDVQKSSLISNHALIDTTGHTVSGLTTDHVMKATGATTYAFGVDPLIDKITTAGDLLYGTAADTAARLGIGTAGQVLKVNSGATAPEWGAATVTKTYRVPHGFALNGTGIVDTLPGFYISLPAGQTAALVACRYATASGTATAAVRRNGTGATGFTGLSVSSTATTTDPSNVALADNDYIDLDISVVSTPVDLRVTVWIEYTV